MLPSRRSFVLAALMGGTAMGALALRPGQRTAAATGGLQLETLVPTEFGHWKMVRDVGAQVVNPQTQQLLDKLYSQILSRTYVDPSGYRIMLSLAYGDDQRGGLQAHRPEVCYPAQGFKVRSNQDGTLPTPFGSVNVRRLETDLGPRVEPVTYWLTVGDTIIRNSWERRLAEIRLGLTGQIPDGLLFRVSSIDGDPKRAFAAQQRFTTDLLAAVPAGARKQLSGLATPESAS